MNSIFVRTHSAAVSRINVMNNYYVKLNISTIDVNTTSDEGHLDLYSHSDTCVLGEHFQIFEDNVKSCTVYPY